MSRRYGRCSALIDIENEIFSPIAKALREQFGGIFVTSEAINGMPTKLPCVGIIEVDNYAPQAKIDTSGKERFSDITYQVTVFTNRTSGRKTESKQIMQLVDTMLFERNFRRESNVPDTPMGNGKIYWRTARYVARTDGKYLYRK